MPQTALTTHVPFFLGALWHLSKCDTQTKVFGLQNVLREIESRWKISITMAEIITAKRWSLENELIDDKRVGYAINELGQEYLRYIQPEYEPITVPSTNHFPPIKKFKRRRR